MKSLRVKVLFGVIVVLLSGCSTTAESVFTSDEGLRQAQLALERNDPEASVQLAERAVALDDSLATLVKAIEILTAAGHPKAGEYQGLYTYRTVFGDFFVIPSDMPIELEGVLTFPKSEEWNLVSEKRCSLEPLQVNLSHGKAEFSSDGSDPVDASTLTVQEGGLFAFKKTLGLGAGIRCAEVKDFSAKMAGRIYSVEMTADYIGNDETECFHTGVLPVKVRVNGELETVWQRDFCSFPRFGLADGPARIVWAGDIDGDSRLDILLQLPVHPMAASFTLLVSGQPEKDYHFSYSRPGNPGC